MEVNCTGRNGRHFDWGVAFGFRFFARARTWAPYTSRARYGRAQKATCPRSAIVFADGVNRARGRRGTCLRCINVGLGSSCFDSCFFARSRTLTVCAHLCGPTLLAVSAGACVLFIVSVAVCVRLCVWLKR